MVILISGGSASGKSAFAEGLVARYPQTERYYIATMQILDAESEVRVERHRTMRQDRGFLTVECPLYLAHLNLSNTATVLVEDIPNLLANACFGDFGLDSGLDLALQGIRHVADREGVTIFVTGELCSDGICYRGETGAYLAQLDALNIAIASIAHEVWEVVAGIPVLWKGEGR